MEICFRQAPPCSNTAAAAIHAAAGADLRSVIARHGNVRQRGMRGELQQRGHKPQSDAAVHCDLISERRPAGGVLAVEPERQALGAAARFDEFIERGCVRLKADTSQNRLQLRASGVEYDVPGRRPSG